MHLYEDDTFAVHNVLNSTKSSCGISMSRVIFFARRMGSRWANDQIPIGVFSFSSFIIVKVSSLNRLTSVRLRLVSPPFEFDID